MMSDKINQTLLKANPNFAELYEQLKKQYLAPDGTTKALVKEIDQEEFIKEKTEYLENLTLYNALQQLSLQNDKEHKEHGKIFETLDKVLSFAESKQYLKFHPTDLSLLKENNYTSNAVEKLEEDVTTTLLGLTEEKLVKRIENELNCLNDSKEIILKSIESKLTKQCEDIAKFYYYTGETGEETNSKLLAAKASQLDKVLNRKLEELRMYKINIVENQIRLGECITTYLKVMKEILTNLWNLIEEFKYRNELEKNTTFIEYFSDIGKSILLKLKVLRLQALTNVYDKKIVESLNVIRTNLIEEETEKNRELKILNNQLVEYQNIGDEFEKIVQAYLDIVKNIETTEDHIRRINQ